jgi:hypothetical protein
MAANDRVADKFFKNTNVLKYYMGGGLRGSHPLKSRTRGEGH